MNHDTRVAAVIHYASAEGKNTPASLRFGMISLVVATTALSATAGICIIETQNLPVPGRFMNIVVEWVMLASACGFIAGVIGLCQDRGRIAAMLGMTVAIIAGAFAPTFFSVGL